MTVKECYDAIGADYEDVMGRLRKDERVQKFVLKLLDDKSYQSASELAERLRNGQEFSEDMKPLLEQVKKDYTHMIDCIKQLA